MDQQKIQGLLEKAAREYNGGKYSEAIAHWQEVLEEDPGNQKAREGIRMAQLLVVNWETPEEEREGGELSLEPEGLDADLQEKIQFGITRVRELMSAGRHQEAMEGCDLLSELAPGMESVRKLKEEVTNAFEAHPFVEEHLGRARKLLAQDKAKEAADEARKVLSLDPANSEAQAILKNVSAAAPVPPEAQASAFDVGTVGKPAPPSPFAGRQDAGDLADQFGIADTGPRPAVTPDRSAEPPEQSPSGEEAPAMELEFEEAASAGGAEVSAESSDKIRSLLEEGRKLFAGERYQEAIDIWSHVYALDETNAAAGELIDQAKARLEEIARQADGAYYRGVDLFEAGKVDEAKRAFEEVLALQPDHADARSYVEQIEERVAGAPEPEEIAAIPLAPESPPPALGEGGAELDAELQAAVSAPLPAIEDVRPPEAPSEEAAKHVTAGPIKKIKRPPPPPSTSRAPILVAAAAVIVVGGAVAAWWFLLGGPGSASRTEAVQSAAVTAPGAPPAAPVATASSGDAGEPGGASEPAGAGAEDRMELVPGSKAPPEPQAPEPSSPRDTRRQVNRLMREGRSLLERKKYAEAKARFEQVLLLDATNFDADDLRGRASELAAAEQKFNDDLRMAKAAFGEGDWPAALYKFYRLREQRRDMTILKRYIKNANYNWGIEAMDAFVIDEAIEHFKDALEMAPANKTIQRARDVAERYRRRRRDAAFDSFVSRLEPKALDAQ